MDELRIKTVPFRCVTCEFKAQIPWEDHFPKDTALVKANCWECLERNGIMDDEYVNAEDYELILARENPNQLALL